MSTDPVKFLQRQIKTMSVRTLLAYALKSRFKRRETVIKSKVGEIAVRDMQERPRLNFRYSTDAPVGRIGLHGPLFTKVSTSRTCDALAPIARHDDAPDAGGSSTVPAARGKEVRK